MRATSLFAGALVLAGLALLSGCPPENCTAEARYSVNVTAVDEDGAPIVIERIVYTVDDEGPFQVECPTTLDGVYCVEGSHQASVGVEREGSFVITVHHGNATGSAEVVVPTADCDHVDPQAVTIVLEGAP